jgi:threonine synthase
MENIHCSNCHRPYPEEGAPYRCLTCGGTFDFITFPIFDKQQVDRSKPGIWAYQPAFGLPENTPNVSLGEGNTSLVWAEAFGRKTAFKLEYLNPSGSFKDRGTAPLVSFLLSRGIQSAVEDSSGNAGASFAAYAARAGMKARIFVPDSASGPKRRQIEAYGAEIVSILGRRSNAAEAVRRAAEGGDVYASHAYLPFTLPGYATLAYELVEQLGDSPGTLVMPVGQGGLMLGAGRGFESLRQAGVIDRMPRLVGVQARACAPLWALSSYGAQGLAWVAEGETLAEGVRVSHPIRGDAVLQIVERSEGLFLSAGEEEIRAGRDQLSWQGFYVEATSALIWSALSQLGEDTPEPVVAVLTGSGLKNPLKY